MPAGIKLTVDSLPFPRSLADEYVPRNRTGLLMKTKFNVTSLGYVGWVRRGGKLAHRPGYGIGACAARQTGDVEVYQSCIRTGDIGAVLLFYKLAELSINWSPFSNLYRFDCHTFLPV